MKGKLIKGLGTCTKSINEYRDVYLKYEYPSGTKVDIDLIHNVYYIKEGDKVIATFEPNDQQNVYDYIEFDQFDDGKHIIIDIEKLSTKTLDELRNAIVTCLEKEARYIKEGLEFWGEDRKDSKAYTDMEEWSEAAYEQAKSVKKQYQSIQDKKYRDYKVEENRKWRVKNGYGI